MSDLPALDRTDVRVLQRDDRDRLAVERHAFDLVRLSIAMNVHHRALEGIGRQFLHHGPHLIAHELVPGKILRQSDGRIALAGR